MFFVCFCRSWLGRLLTNSKGAALQYRDIVDFLNRSRISYAISADPTVSRPYLNQFWEIAEHDCTVTPNVIRATVAGHAIAFSEDSIRRVLQFRDLATDPTTYPDYFVDGCWRQRMGYVGARDYASYKKMWVLDQWRYFAHVMIMCISSRKAGKYTMGHDLAAAMVAFLSTRATTSPATSLRPSMIRSTQQRGERLQVKRVDKRVFAQFLKPGSVDPTPVHTELFGHLIIVAYVAPGEEMESDDGSSNDGDDEGGNEGAEGSDSEATESGSSDSDDAPSQSSSNEYEPDSDSDSDAAIQRQRRESVHKNRGDRQQPSVPSVVEAQQQVQVSAASPDSASTPPSQQLYRRRRRPQVQSEVAVTTITEVIPVIVTLPTTTVQVAVTTPVLTKSVTITPTITPTTLVISSIPTTTTEPLSQPFNYGDFTQGFDFDTIFSSPTHNAEASSSRHPDPNDARIDVLETQVAELLETVRKSKEESDAQQAQINSLVDEVRILRSQRTGTEERLKNVLAQNELLIKTNEMLLGHESSLELRFDFQRKEHEPMVKLIVDLTKKLDAQGENEKEKEKEKEKRTTGDEACHPVDLTKDYDKNKDPEAGPSGGEHQALAIVPISAVPMAQGESTHQKSGDTSGGGGGDKGKSVAEVLKDLSDDEILYLDPGYSKEAQIDALFNLEEGEIDSGDDWDDDEDVVIEIPKGDGEGEYELEDGEIFEFPSFDAPLDTGSVEQASNVEASTEASLVDPAPVDPEAPKDTNMPSTSSKGPAPVWQKTSIIDKHGATGMILAARFEEDKQLFAIKRSGGVQYLKPTSEAFNSLPKYDLVNLAN
ncbi:hypothetical protein L1987_48557 [Smallanthus sonchifolius]|uniref:Uncharacterized protein n=1 Tax=Smallanthus sonchifolius TaxID=185202 RepID=A0ACB9FSB1_9ASTR|nr:hypothetical protein L1987_48557 [Smallanthus sonchifolius]